MTHARSAGIAGWDGVHELGKRPSGVHPWALVGAPPEMRSWMVGDPMLEPEIGEDVLVDAFCTIDAGRADLPATRVGDRTWLQKRVHVGHNASIGVDCEICVGVVICGEVTVGDGVKIAGNAWVKPQVTIGEGAVIGGGSVVTKDVPAHEVWAGNPARYMKLARTHPDYLMGREGFENRREHAWQYVMTDAEWDASERALERPAGFPSPEDLVGYGAMELEAEMARSGGKLRQR